MTRTMTWMGLLVALALAVGQVSFVQAAPLQQVPTTDITIMEITPTYDTTTPTLVNGYDVTYSYQGGFTETVHLTIQEAYDWGLLQTDPTTGNTYYIDPTTGNPVPIVSAGDMIPVSTDIVGTDPCAAPAGGGQAVGEALAGAFCGSQGVSYDTIMGWQTSGYGFGVIAQALFMAQALGADPTLAATILAAKTSGDYSALEAALQGMGYDTSTVKNWNWGQVKKLVMSDAVKSMTNLGAVMSGRQGPFVPPLAPASVTTTTTTTTVTTDTSTKPGNGKGKAKGQNGGGNGNNGNGNGNNGNNGKANGKNKGN